MNPRAIEAFMNLWGIEKIENPVPNRDQNVAFGQLVEAYVTRGVFNSLPRFDVLVHKDKSLELVWANGTYEFVVEISKTGGIGWDFWDNKTQGERSGKRDADAARIQEDFCFYMELMQPPLSDGLEGI